MAGEFEMQFTTEGWAEVRAALRHATVEVLNAVTQAMIENVEDLLGRAMRDAPIDEGTLRGSGSARVNRGQTARAVMQTDEAGNITHSLRSIQDSDTGALIDLRGHPVIEGEVGFNTPYAAYQHEHTEFEHPRGGKAKYLEDNLKEQTQRYVQNLVQAVREVTR